MALTLPGSRYIFRAPQVQNKHGPSKEMSTNSMTTSSIFTGNHLDDSNREQHYQLLVDNSHGIIYELLPNGYFSFVSPSWTLELGHDLADIVGHDFREFVHPDDIPPCEAFMYRTMETGEVQRGAVYRVFHVDGGIRWHRSNIVPCYNQQHELASFVGNAVDITEHIRYEEELKQRSDELYKINLTLEKRIEEETERRIKQELINARTARLAAMGEMVAAIAHQWRQPLTAVSALVQNIQVAYDCGQLSEQFIRKTVDTALRQCTFMSDTIDEFRGLLLPGKRAETFVLRPEIEKTLDLIRPQLSNHGINATVQSSGTPEITIHSFPGEFKQVILNLVSNAKDAIIERKLRQQHDEPAGRIDIFIERNNGGVQVRVSDNGGGITPELQERIFEPYFTTKAERFGTGIGLYTCRMIVETSMGGTLSVDNSEDGVCFTILVPVGE